MTITGLPKGQPASFRIVTSHILLESNSSCFFYEILLVRVS